LRVPKSGGIPTTKARVVRWFKKEGSKVKQGEPVVELETDKVNYELDSPVAGVLLKIVAAVDAEVPVGDPLGCIGQPGEALPEF
jgi:pyruvate dehydrogenase E2 component (dihydrolipoamide acetyltransferase)